jgi:hypothetical protein
VRRGKRHCKKWYWCTSSRLARLTGPLVPKFYSACTPPPFQATRERELRIQLDKATVLLRRFARPPVDPGAMPYLPAGQLRPPSPQSPGQQPNCNWRPSLPTVRCNSRTAAVPALRSLCLMGVPNATTTLRYTRAGALPGASGPTAGAGRQGGRPEQHQRPAHAAASISSGSGR